MACRRTTDRVTVRVFLVDDHEIVRRGVRDLIAADDTLTVVGEAGSAADALALLPACRPDVAVLDVRLPDGDGVELCRELRSSHEGLIALMLTSFDDDDALLNAVMAGAAGYVLKQIRGTELVDAIKRVATGESLLSNAVKHRAFERLRAGSVSSRVEVPLESLTAQERAVLDLIAEGCTNRQIAGRLFLAEQTVKNYVSNLLRKLGMERRTEAAIYATRISTRRASGSAGSRPGTYPGPQW